MSSPEPSAEETIGNGVAPSSLWYYALREEEPSSSLAARVHVYDKSVRWLFRPPEPFGRRPFELAC